MRVNQLAAAAFLPLALFFGACGDDDNDDGTEVTTETTTGGEKTDEGSAVTLKAALRGDEEVPGPGADPAVGSGQVQVAGTQVCAELNVTMGEKPTAAHIHQGAKGESGPVVVDLQPEFTPGESAFVSPRKCVEAPADTAAALIADPSGYYLNIHSTEHPDGAVRGQLDRF